MKFLLVKEKVIIYFLIFLFGAYKPTHPVISQFSR